MAFRAVKKAGHSFEKGDGMIKIIGIGLSIILAVVLFAFGIFCWINGILLFNDGKQIEALYYLLLAVLILKK